MLTLLRALIDCSQRSVICADTRPVFCVLWLVGATSCAVAWSSSATWCPSSGRRRRRTRRVCSRRACRTSRARRTRRASARSSACSPRRDPTSGCARAAASATRTIPILCCARSRQSGQLCEIEARGLEFEFRDSQSERVRIQREREREGEREVAQTHVDARNMRILCVLFATLWTQVTSAQLSSCSELRSTSNASRASRQCNAARCSPSIRTCASGLPRCARKTAAAKWRRTRGASAACRSPSTCPRPRRRTRRVQAEEASSRLRASEC